MATYRLFQAPFYIDYGTGLASVSGGGQLVFSGNEGFTFAPPTMGRTERMGAFAQTYLLAENPMDLDETAPDTTGPVFSAFTPADGSSIAANDAISFTVSDPDSGLSGLVVYASMNGGAEELVYGGGSGTGYSVTPVGDFSTSLTLTMTRNAGWYGTVQLRAFAVDMVGNTTTEGADYTAPAAPPTGDIVPPVVTNISPAAGTPIGTTQAITMEITDETGLALVLVTANYVTADWVEVAYDGTSFTGPFQRRSTKTAITNGYRLTILREDGWPSTVTLTPYVVDTGGNLNS